MVSDSDQWWNKYYQGNTKHYLDLLLNQNNPQGTKSLATNQRQVYDRLPIRLRWNEEEERNGTAYSGAVLDYFTPPPIYGGQYIPDSVPVTVEPITPVTTVQPQQEHIISLTSTTSKIINDITSGVLQIPEWFYHNVEWVKSGEISENTFLTAYHNLVNQHLIHEAIAEPEPEPALVTDWYWVTKTSGIIERMKVSQNFINTMTAQGWIFSKEKPTIEEPQNQNISIIFYIGKGGDLKTHFGINSIVVTPDEAEQLAGWLYQNYNTKILFVMNRLTDDVRTHTLQQIKGLVIQKLKDEEPVSDDITSDDIKKPKELGFMGAGMAGAIAGLVLLGFIVDHKVGKT